jgi:hypothetical protein
VRPFALQKVKRVPRNLLKIYKIIIKIKKNPPHPLSPARVKNNNKSLTHNTKNNKKGEK